MRPHPNDSVARVVGRKVFVVAFRLFLDLLVSAGEKDFLLSNLFTTFVGFFREAYGARMVE